MEIKNSADLRAAILDLENKSKREKHLLLEDFHSFKESLTPINLIKSTINKVKETPGITGAVIKATLGLGIGLLSKRLLVGKSPGVLRRIIGTAIEMGVAGLVAKKTDTIKGTGFQVFKNFFRSKK